MAAAAKAARESGVISGKPDRVTQYALDVAEGRIVAGPHVRGACRRHLVDLVNGPDRGLRWEPGDAGAEHYFSFAEKYCTVLCVREEDVEEYGTTKPFHLEPAQAFITGSLFGWKKANGTRRFRTAYVETAKGSGKSPLAGSVGLYMMTSDGEARAEVYSAATKKDQAMILFQDAVSMVDGSDALSSRIVKSGVRPVYRLSHPRTASVFKPISADDGQSGPRPSCALIDEVHEHRDDYVIRMLRAGFKFRRQPLLFLITNSGFDKQSVCYEYHERGTKVCAGDVEDDSFFAFIASLDDDDDPFTDESCWIKANPTLGATITVDYLREQVDEARKLPSSRNTCLRLNFCRWTDAESAWMTREVWTAAEFGEEEADVRIEDFAGAECYLATDLAFTTDLAAVAAVFPDGRDLFLFVDYWTPRETLYERADRDHVPYALWAALEEHAEEPRFINATPGNVIPLESIAARLKWYDETFNVAGYAYDEYRHKDLETQLEDLGLAPLVGKMIAHPQGFRRAGLLYDKRGQPVKDAKGVHIENPLWMPASLEALTHSILEASSVESSGKNWRLRAQPNPVLRWNVSSAVVRPDPAGTGGEVFTKLKSTGRIDGLVASAMAVGLALAPPIRRKTLRGMISAPVVVK